MPTGWAPRLTAWRGPSGCPAGSSSCSGPSSCLRKQRTLRSGRGPCPAPPILLARGPTFVLVDLVDHAAQRLYVLGQLLQLVQVLLLLGLAGAGGAHDGAGVHCRTWPGERGPAHGGRGCARPSPHLPGVFSGPGEGTLKFCGVRAVTGLWEGCGEGLGRKLLGDGAGPELAERRRVSRGGAGARGGGGPRPGLPDVGAGLRAGRAGLRGRLRGRRHGLRGVHLLARRRRGQHGEAALADLRGGRAC